MSLASLFSACLFHADVYPEHFGTLVLLLTCSLHVCSLAYMFPLCLFGCSPAYFSMHAASSAVFPLMCPCSLVPLHAVTLHTCPLQPCSLHACFHAYVYPEYFMACLFSCLRAPCIHVPLHPCPLHICSLEVGCLFPCILTSHMFVPLYTCLCWFLCMIFTLLHACSPHLSKLVTLHLFPARL
jgi:hypothetical protein